MTWNDENCSRTHERYMGNVLDSAREHYIAVSVHYDTMGCYGSGVFAMACYGWQKSELADECNAPPSPSDASLFSIALLSEWPGGRRS
jgi:hypothetical protein